VISRVATAWNGREPGGAERNEAGKNRRAVGGGLEAILIAVHFMLYFESGSDV
jgi:hypothetical protein